MPKRFAATVLSGVLLSISAAAFAADDPSIKGDLRADIKKAMLEHVGANTLDGDYIIYDAVEGNLLRLKFDALHDGIVKKGDFYVACGDFNAHDGTYYDLDMLVAEKADGRMLVLQSVVHKREDEKREYHVENVED